MVKLICKCKKCDQSFGLCIGVSSLLSVRIQVRQSIQDSKKKKKEEKELTFSVLSG